MKIIEERSTYRIKEFLLHSLSHEEVLSEEEGGGNSRSNESGGGENWGYDVNTARITQKNLELCIFRQYYSK